MCAYEPRAKDDQAFKNMREILTLCLFTCVLDIQREGLSVGSAHCAQLKITLLKSKKTAKNAADNASLYHITIVLV